jgi:polyisoprenoid-binding protein YceI
MISRDSMSKTSSTIDAAGLAKLLESPRPPQLVDVRLEEDCQCTRLPGSRNNCVYEVAFLDRMPDVAPDLNLPVCVYGADSGSLESRMAAEKLCRHGYQEVYDFRDGLAGWKAAGYEVKETGATVAAAPKVADGVHGIDLGESHVRWVGRNLLNMHEGDVGLKSGSLRIENGKLAGGEFVIDMTAISSRDLAGNPLHDVLMRHLHDHDFFDTELYPEARFVIEKATDIPNATPGAPNLNISGTLTLKGVSGPVEFPACAGVTPEGKLGAQATLSFDRTKWNVLYGSGKWFRHLAGHLVNDLIDLQLRIVSA